MRSRESKRYPIETNRWYNAIVGKDNELIKVMKYNADNWCVVTYYKGLILLVGSLNECRKYVHEKAVSL